MSQNLAKKKAGEKAAQCVESGMTVGLGTGSTTAFAIAALGRRIRQEGLSIRGIPTSSSAELEARKQGVPICTFDDIEGRLDIAVDGADEVSPGLDLIKGRGAAHTREKLVASQADRFIVLVDTSKLVKQLGIKMPVPIEVIPMAAPVVLRTLQAMGAAAALRLGLRKDGPIVSDQGFWIIDAQFGPISDPAALSRTLLEMPGVLDHGLFVGLATEVIVGTEAGAEVLVRNS
ncbi:MAG: ribose-5-phosphate isomerase RpiA [Rhodothermaceae bacterium]|nr:ribose-5-phosphate isomerase RpiA [Rhodothermaceae bacterium]MYF63563.1 ribose-5-phosphate isomerase RpiA [Rhodothermaceae bacterium]MYI84721.1 ribose-5-phosphate isomerase RpiA [Rhodothermaceae bacterium]